MIAGTAFYKTRGPLWPIVSVASPGTKIEGNFGNSDFLWNGLKTYKLEKKSPGPEAGDISPLASEDISDIDSERSVDSRGTDASGSRNNDDDDDGDGDGEGESEGEIDTDDHESDSSDDAEEDNEGDDNEAKRG